MWDHPPWCVVYFSHSKWKADRGAVTSLCVSPDGKLLLSAGHTIKMWDLDTKEVYRVSLDIWDGVTSYEGTMSDRALLSDACLRPNVTPPLQKFTGHSTAVTTLCFATTRPPDSNGLYFLSGAAHDRLLSVWWVLARPSPLIYSSATLGRLSPFYRLAFPPTGKCERMERTRIQWCHLRWLTSRNTSTSSRLIAGRRWEWRNTLSEEFVTKGWVRKHLNIYFISKNETQIINRRSCNGFFSRQRTRSVIQQQPIP